MQCYIHRLSILLLTVFLIHCPEEECIDDNDCPWGQICRANECIVPPDGDADGDSDGDRDEGCDIGGFTIEGICPEDCTEGFDVDAPRDTGYEEDTCNGLSNDGICVSNLLMWCGGPPGSGDSHMEIRWNCCPMYESADGTGKICGYNPVAEVQDCIPDGCQHFRNWNEWTCSGNLCQWCDTSQSGGRLYQCDFEPSTAGAGYGGFYVHDGC